MAALALPAALGADAATIVGGFSGAPMSDALLDGMLETFTFADASMRADDKVMCANTFILHRKTRKFRVNVTVRNALPLTLDGSEVDPADLRTRPVSQTMQDQEFPFTREGLRGAIELSQREMSRFKHNGMCDHCWKKNRLGRYAVAKTKKCCACIYKSAVL